MTISFAPHALLRAGFAAIAMIKERTLRKHVDVHGHPFIAYAESTIKRKGPRAKHGVNLSEHGVMLAGMVPALRMNSVIIAFSRDEDAKKAQWHSVLGAGKPRVVREFYALSDDELLAIVPKAVEGIRVEM